MPIDIGIIASDVSETISNRIRRRRAGDSRLFASIAAVENSHLLYLIVHRHLICQSASRRHPKFHLRGRFGFRAYRSCQMPH